LRGDGRTLLRKTRFSYSRLSDKQKQAPGSSIRTIGQISYKRYFRFTTHETTIEGRVPNYVESAVHRTQFHFRHLARVALSIPRTWF
jgi:hypothetical protein